MPDEPLVSVVIATHDRWQLLTESIGSVLSQSWADFELIVVDDGSTDGTPERLAREFPELTVVRQRNQERGVAYNRGIAESRGRYVAFLDDDDIYEPWHLDQFATAHGRFPDADAFASRAALWDPATGRQRLLPAFDTDTLARDALVGTVLSPQTLVVRRSVLVELGGFPEEREVTLASDWILLLKLAHRCAVQPLERPSVRIREHPGRGMNDVLAISRSREDATRLILDGGLLGYELDGPSRRLLVAGTHRLSAAHLYGCGDMDGARNELHAARRVLGWRDGWRWTAKLWAQTWLGPTGSRMARASKDRLAWSRPALRAGRRH